MTGLLVLFGPPNAPNEFVYGLLFTVVSFVEGVILVATPALVRDFSPQLGRASAMGFWTLGPVVGSLVLSEVFSHTINIVGVREPFMVVGAVGATIVFLSRTSHPDTGYYTFVWIITLLAVSWESPRHAVDARTPAALAAQPANQGAAVTAVRDIAPTFHVDTATATRRLQAATVVPRADLQFLRQHLTEVEQASRSTPGQWQSWGGSAWAVRPSSCR